MRLGLPCVWFSGLSAPWTLASNKHSLNILLCGYFFGCCDKIPGKRNLRRKSLFWVTVEGTVHPSGESRYPGTVCLHQGYWLNTGPQSHGMVLPAFRTVFLPQLNFFGNALKGTSRDLSWVFLSLKMLARYSITVSTFRCLVSSVLCPELSSLSSDMLFSSQVYRMITRL